MDFLLLTGYVGLLAFVALCGFWCAWKATAWAWRRLRRPRLTPVENPPFVFDGQRVYVPPTRFRAGLPTLAWQEQPLTPRPAPLTRREPPPEVLPDYSPEDAAATAAAFTNLLMSPSAQALTTDPTTTGPWAGTGGTFAGGGASGSWEDDSAKAASPSVESAPVDSSPSYDSGSCDSGSCDSGGSDGGGGSD